MSVVIRHGDCREVMGGMEPDSIDAIVTDPPYGLEFMGKEWDSFAPRDRKNASVWDGRRRAQKGWEAHAASRSGLGGSGPSYTSSHKGKKQCVACGKREFSGTPCRCVSPQWLIEHRQEAPTAMLAFQAFCAEWAREAYRVLKPGGHLLAFGGARTYHRLACAIEDAGFEIRDQVMWIYGSGFPKSRDVSKAIDEEAGEKRKTAYLPHGDNKIFGEGKGKASGVDRTPGAYLSGPALTEAARQWQGWGTALKPAHEPIVLARKPLVGTVAENVQQHGTGALNIDECRIEGRERTEYGLANAIRSKVSTYGEPSSCADFDSSKGRWPANIIHDGSDEVEAAFAVFGSEKGGRWGAPSSGVSSGYHGGIASGLDAQERSIGDTGTASRFFYCAKASKKDRDDGLAGMPLRKNDFHRQSSGLNQDRPGREGRKPNLHGARNHHPTVKPTSLMRYLCRLITPPDGTVLDPFAGSGSTGRGAVLEGFNFIGIEMDEHYANMAGLRINAAMNQVPAQGVLL